MRSRHLFAGLWVVLLTGALLALTLGSVGAPRVAAQARQAIERQSEVFALQSAARTVTTDSAEFVNFGAVGVRLYLDVTAASGTTPTLACKLQGKDPASGDWVDVAGAAWAQQTTTTALPLELVVYPGIAETANAAVSDVLPFRWRATCAVAGTTPSFTFSIAGSYIG